MTSTYAFRDNDLAAERLGLLAEIFEPTTRAFLERSGPRQPGLALDLGCGTGHTTRLLAATLRPRRTLGLDASARFVALAHGADFEVRDVTDGPLPRAEVGYCRFLLAHLPEPLEVVARWRTSVRTLLVEEVEWIATDDPAFRRYLGTVREMLARRGHRLEIGPELGERYGGEVVTLAPDPAAVARMFALNARAWSDEAPPGLADELAGARGPIVWGLRQIAIHGEAA